MAGAIVSWLVLVVGFGGYFLSAGHPQWYAVFRIGQVTAVGCLLGALFLIILGHRGGGTAGIFILALALPLAGCGEWWLTPEERTRRAELRVGQVSFAANLENVGRAITYLHEPRSGLCFAYFWGTGGNQGGPALSEVPCERVEHLLPSSMRADVAETRGGRE